MLPITIQRAAVGLGSLSVQILGGILDVIHVGVEGATGTGDKAAYYAALLASMRVNGSRISKSGASNAFVTGMTGTAFREINNLFGGYVRTADGFFIPTGHQVFGLEDGVSLNLDWTPPTEANVDATNVKVVVRRVRDISEPYASEPLLLFEAQAVTATAQRFTQTVPNIRRMIYVGDKLTSATLQLGGEEYTEEQGFLEAQAGANFSHEQDSVAGALQLFASHPDVPTPAPSVTVYTSVASGLVVQMGQTA